MINIEQLTTELTPYGNILFLGENNEMSFVIAMNEVTTDEQTIENIVHSHISGDYPNEITRTLIDGVYKAHHQK
jgi:hypothetical protein